MTRPAKLLFDECIGFPIVEQIRGIIGIDPTVSIQHVVPLGFGGEDDEIWIPKIAGEGWVIVTGDRGKRKRGRGEKLPIVCAACGVTYAMLSRTIVHYKSFGKYRVIMELWDKLVSLKDEPPGSGFSIQPAGSHFTIKLTRPAPIPSPGEQLDFLRPENGQT